LRCLAALLVIAVISHFTLVATLPYLVMHVVSTRVASLIGGNSILYAPRITADDRVVPMPSPDLLYTLCLFDLGKHSLLVRADMPDTYGSVAMYASNSDAFQVIDGHDAAGHRIEVALVGPDGSPPAQLPPAARVVRAPTARGLIMFRIFLDSPQDVERLTAIQHTAYCQPF
jgi:uncharacterized membrane protein